MLEVRNGQDWLHHGGRRRYGQGLHTGSTQVMLFNHSEIADLVYNHNQTIGQLLVLKKFDGMAFWRDETDYGQPPDKPIQILLKDIRSDGEFGSTGK